MQTFLKMLLLCCVLAFSHFASGHIVLTYPPARGYPLDFLDNVRTKAPCGMPKGLPMTDLKGGAKYTITWSQAYPHKGNFAIEILDSDEMLKTVLKNFTTGGNTESLEYEVTLPDECDNCTLRLIRQASEWSNAACGFSYEFWSCADINIVKPDVSADKKCTSTARGTWGGATCNCNGLYYGSACQYEYDCKTNTDCNNNGECVTVTTESTYQPKQCFCDAGWMGQKCDKASAIKEKITDFSSYERVTLQYNPTFDLLYKNDSDKITVVVRAKTDSWVGIGWRPLDYKSGCQAFPTLVFPSANSDITTPVPEPTTTAAGCNAEPEGKPEPEPETVTEPSGEKYVKPNTGGKPHPMDCTDMVIGAVNGERYAIGDYYTRDRSRPLRDEIYGGTDSLTAAFGYQEGGMTVIIFQRPLEASERTDYSITSSTMHVIWARGQKAGQFSHTPEAGVSNSGKYYKDDELKYHGTATQRGQTTVQFIGADDTTAVPKYATGALTSQDANMVVNWVYLDESKSIEFNVKVMNHNNNRWAGLGFSKDKSMINSDVVIMTYDQAGAFVLSDRWISGYSTPVADSQQDVTFSTSTLIDNELNVKLVRRADTGDSKDVQFGSKTNCVYLLLARGPTSGNSISKHDMKEVSTNKVCIASDAMPSGRDEDEDGLGTVDKIIIGVTVAVVALCIILGCVLCINSTLKKGHERDEKKYRTNSEYGESVVDKDNMMYSNVSTARPISNVSSPPSYGRPYDPYENKPMDVEIVDNSGNTVGYSEWVSKVNRGYPAY